MISAIYVGSILTMLPLYGVQLGLAFIASLVFRANLMIAVALQFVSNPFTIPFLYWLEYKTGDFVLTTFGFSFHEDVIPYFSEVAEEEAIAVVTEGGTRPRWGYWIFATMIGGFVLGLGLAVILSLTYQLILSKTRLFANRANADDIHQPNRNKHGSSTP